MSTVLVILGVAVLILALLIANNIYANRTVNDPFVGDEPVDITPVWFTAAIGVGLLIGAVVSYAMAPTPNRAHQYIGQQLDADPGEPEMTQDKSGQAKRFGGEY